MSDLTIADTLKYANRQMAAEMAAEAFLVNDDGSVKQDLVTALKEGNGHTSVITSRFSDPIVRDFYLAVTSDNDPSNFPSHDVQNQNTWRQVA